MRERGIQRLHMRLMAAHIPGDGDSERESGARLVLPQAPVDTAVRPEFRALFEAEFAYVWRALRRLGVRAADAEDVTHDVFLKIHHKLGAYDPTRPLRPWLFGFAFRFASDYRDLARHRFEVLADVGEPQAGTPDALDRALQNEAIEQARKALAAIELERRAVFILHELDEYSIPEVAHALGIPVNTAYSRLRLARADLARAVRRLRLRGEP